MTLIMANRVYATYNKRFKKYAAIYRAAMIKAVSTALDKYKDRKIGIALSGGSDSATVLFAMMECGVKPHCFIFKLANIDSSDSRVALDMCRTLDVPHTLVEAPSTMESLEAATKTMLMQGCPPKKASVQSTHCYLFVYEEAARQGFNTLFTGMAGDLYFNTVRKADQKMRGQPDNVNKWFRRDLLANTASENEGSMLGIRKAREHHGFVDYCPFLDPEFIEVALNIPMVFMNYLGKTKHIQNYAFVEYWKRGQWYRDNSPLQINSGLREFHDRFLDSPHNYTKAKDVAVIYRQFLGEIISERDDRKANEKSAALVAKRRETSSRVRTLLDRTRSRRGNASGVDGPTE